MALGRADSFWRGPRVAVAILLPLASAATALTAVPTQAAHPYTGAPIVYVGVEDQFVREEGFVGTRPVGLRGIRLGEPKGAARQLTTDPGDSDPAVSPNGRLIAFSRPIGPEGNQTGAIMLMRSDGTGLRQLTDGAGGASSDSEPSFAPSGKRLLFVRAEDETVPGSNKGDVYSIRVDGTDLRQITSGRSADSAPVSSPSGRQVVFAREPFRRGEGGDPDWGLQHIYSVRSDGSRPRDLTPRIPARRRPGERNFEAEDPAFSPRGRAVAFTVSANGDENIYTMRPNGARLRSLTGVGEHPLGTRFDLSEASFSPSGRFLLVTARDRIRTELAVIDLADRTRLRSASSLQGESPAWVP